MHNSKHLFVILTQDSGYNAKMDGYFPVRFDLRKFLI